MVLGSFTLQKYAYQIHHNQWFGLRPTSPTIYIGEKNASYVKPTGPEPNPDPDPVNPDDPTDPTEKHTGLIVSMIFLGILVFSAVGLFAAHKLGWICNKSKVKENADFGDIKKGLN